MIKDALISEEVVEIDKIGISSDKEIDILSNEYLKRLERIPFKNQKVKLMERLLKQVISSLQRINKRKGVDFTQRLDGIVKKYNDRSDDASAPVIIDEVIQQMTDLLSDVAAVRTAGDALGLNVEENAFYDILKAVATKYNFYNVYGDDKLSALAKDIKAIVDDKARYTDWANRGDIKAELQVDVLVCMAQHKYPPRDHYDEVYKEILEQAENFKRYRLQ